MHDVTLEMVYIIIYIYMYVYMENNIAENRPRGQHELRFSSMLRMQMLCNSRFVSQASIH
jgi:hypothetical protein